MLHEVTHQIQTCEKRGFGRKKQVPDTVLTSEPWADSKITSFFCHPDVQCSMKAVGLLLIEDGIDRPLLDMCPLAVYPGLVREQIQADIRVCAIVAEAEYVPAGNRCTQRVPIQNWLAILIEEKIIRLFNDRN